MQEFSPVWKNHVPQIVPQVSPSCHYAISAQASQRWLWMCARMNEMEIAE